MGCRVGTWSDGLHKEVQMAAHTGERAQKAGGFHCAKSAAKVSQLV
jgi:hypothetical protein